MSKMVKVNGCWRPGETDCEMCGLPKPTLEVNWCEVFDHPPQLVCTQCRKIMLTWSPLGVWGTTAPPEPVRKPGRKKKPKVVKAPGVPAYVEGEEEIEVMELPVEEPFTLQIESDFNIDDL